MNDPIRLIILMAAFVFSVTWSMAIRYWYVVAITIGLIFLATHVQAQEITFQRLPNHLAQTVAITIKPNPDSLTRMELRAMNQADWISTVCVNPDLKECSMIVIFDKGRDVGDLLSWIERICRREEI